MMEKYVTEFMISDNESKASAENIAQIVNNPDEKTSMLLLIQILGQYLTSSDDSIRSKATSLLSYTLEHMEKELNDSAINVLVSFYCSRLSDQSSVSNLLPGLVALTSKFKHFNKDCTLKVTESISNDIRVQAFPHITRNAAFKTYENLLDYHQENVNSIRNKFITGFIQSISGEKDPRNLMTVYTIIEKIVHKLDISGHVEDIFSATFCYFPITFRPPADNPYGLTAKDLKSSLRKCMASTPLFSEFALPLLIQKGSTTSGSAKKDSLETIAACAAVYPSDEILAVAPKLFDVIKVEIINGDPDPGLRDPSLEAINAITKAITTTTKGSDYESKVTAVLKPLVDDCVHLLEELDEDTVKPASLVLRAIASASPFAYTNIESAILPILLRQYRINDSMADRYLILCTVVAIIQARKIVYGAATQEDSIEVGHDSVLVSYKAKFIEIFSAAIKASKEHPEVRLMGILGIGLLCVLKGYMTRDERTICVQELSSVLETEEEERLRVSVEMSIIEIATFDPDLITRVTIPTLMKILPDFTSEGNGIDSADIVSFKLTLSTIKKLCTPPIIYEATEQDMIEKFLYICSHNQDKPYALEIISTLFTLIQTKDNERQPDIKLCAETLLPKLVTSVISAVIDDTSDKSQVIILSPEITEVINLILLTILKNLGQTEQEEFATKTFRHFVDLDLKDLNLTVDSSFCPLSSSASQTQAACTQLFATVIASFRKSVTMPIESNESFLDKIVEESLKSPHQAQIVSFSRIVASVINKWKDDEAFEAYLNVLKTRLERLIEDKSTSALTVYIWITKALVARTHKKSNEMVDYIIEKISDPVIGKSAASGFDILIGDDPLCLNKQCYANLSFLYKQKFMTYCLPKLLSKFNASQRDEKLNFLVAIAYLLKNVPRSILIDQLPPLVPLLIESMSFPDTVLKLSTLDLFQFALVEATDIMAKYIITLLATFTSLVQPKEKSMKVRISALKCLELVSTKVSRDIVLPYVKSTLKDLAVPLDDKKRLVRKQAVECRESWFLISQKPQ